jgi:hypothetical protein
MDCTPLTSDRNSELTTSHQEVVSGAISVGSGRNGGRRGNAQAE